MYSFLLGFQIVSLKTEYLESYCLLIKSSWFTKKDIWKATPIISRKDILLALMYFVVFNRNTEGLCYQIIKPVPAQQILLHALPFITKILHFMRLLRTQA